MAPYGNIPTKDFIIETIKNEVLSGKMEPGTELAQEALAERLGVSRMPIREALQNLVQEGFAVRLPNRHMQAVVLNSEQIHDVFRMTSLLVAENTILLMKKEKGREKDISVLDFLDRPADEQLDQILNGMENAPDVKRMAEWEILFHERLISLLENPYLEQMQMKSLQGYVTYAIEHLGDKKAVVQQLRKVTEAMRTDDSDQVREAYDEYYTTYAEAYVALREKTARELAESKEDAASEVLTESQNQSVEPEEEKEKTSTVVSKAKEEEILPEDKMEKIQSTEVKVNPQIDDETKKEEEFSEVESEKEEQMQIAGVKGNPQISDDGKMNVNSQIRDAEEKLTVNPWISDTEKKVTVTPQIGDWDEDSETVSRKAEKEKQVEEITADEVSKFLV